MPTLYRKYRPQIFSDLTGQEHIIKTIENAITANKVSHAYLFSGPRGVGKTTLARLLAKSVNCPNRAPGAFEPCNTCSSCEEIAAGRNIDVIEIDAASHTGVDNVRENIIDNAQFKPTKSPYKVFIIDEVHMLSTSAFNALLKTLEEPPAHIIFILATTEMQKLPATIISRCQRFNFSKISAEAMVQKLKSIAQAEEVEVDNEVLKKVVHKSDGCMRDAESLFGQILSLNLKKITAEDTESVLPSSRPDKIITLLENVFAHNAKTGFTLLSDLVKEGVNLENFFYGIIDVLRLLLIIKNGHTPDELSDYDEESVKRIKKISTQATSQNLIHLIDSALDRRQEIKRAPLPQLPIELWIVEASNTEASVTNGNPPAVLPPPPPPSTPTATTTISAPAPTPTATPPEPIKQSTANKITETIKTAISTITHHSQPLFTLEQALEKWGEVIKKVGETNHSLTFILSMCKLAEVNSEGLVISFPYSFHKEKVEEKKTKKMIEEIFSRLLNDRVNLICKVEGTAKHDNTSQEITQLANDFGGEVVE